MRSSQEVVSLNKYLLLYMTKSKNYWGFEKNGPSTFVKDSKTINTYVIEYGDYESDIIFIFTNDRNSENSIYFSDLT
jgi:hypothetical protein